jgi:hypothetical protein
MCRKTIRQRLVPGCLLGSLLRVVSRGLGLFRGGLLRGGLLCGESGSLGLSRNCLLSSVSRCLGLLRSGLLCGGPQRRLCLLCCLFCCKQRGLACCLLSGVLGDQLGLPRRFFRHCRIANMLRSRRALRRGLLPGLLI